MSNMNDKTSGVKLLEEIREELKTANLYNKELKDIIYLFISNLEQDKKINNNSEYLELSNGSKFQTAEVTVLTEEDQNPWTATGGFEQPTAEFEESFPRLEREMWELRAKKRRHHIADTELSHLLRCLHTEPSSRLGVEDLRLCVANWLTTGVGYQAPYYPHQMWEQNKKHKVPYWQSNLDKGREAADTYTATAPAANFEAFDAARRKARRSA